MIVLIPYVNLLNLFRIIKCLFLRNMEPVIHINAIVFGTGYPLFGVKIFFSVSNGKCNIFIGLFGAR